MKRLIYLLFLLPLLSQAQQDTGVHFQDDLSWTAAKAKAAAEKKYIFVDFYTTWCGPCKMMKKVVFPTAAAGEYFNTNFVNISVQLDSTKDDNERVKGWYTDAHNLATEYNIHVYPTFMVFTADGKPITRLAGSSNVAQFIQRVKTAMQPDNQYYTLLSNFQKGQRDTVFLHRMLNAAMEVYDMKLASECGNLYLAAQKDLYTKENLIFIAMVTDKSTDKGFQILLNDPEKVDAVAGKGQAERKVFQIVIKEDIHPAFRSAATPDWTALHKKLSAKYPRQADEFTAKSKVIYYQSKNDWTGFETAIVDYMKKYGAKASSEELNDYAWTVFQHCPDMTCVSEALDWSKRSFKDEPNPAFMDTYANILYKMGKKDDAIAWEQKALDGSGDSEKSSYQQTLDKMKKGEKTWD